MALDDCQDVVEIMRHAASQLADGFHFLCLQKLLLQFPAFGAFRGFL